MSSKKGNKKKNKNKNKNKQINTMGITFASGANDRSMHGRVRKFVNQQQTETGLIKSMDHRRDLPL